MSKFFCRPEILFSAFLVLVISGFIVLLVNRGEGDSGIIDDLVNFIIIK